MFGGILRGNGGVPRLSRSCRSTSVRISPNKKTLHVHTQDSLLQFRLQSIHLPKETLIPGKLCLLIRRIDWPAPAHSTYARWMYMKMITAGSLSLSACWLFAPPEALSHQSSVPSLKLSTGSGKRILICWQNSSRPSVLKERSSFCAQALILSTSSRVVHPVVSKFDTSFKPSAGWMMQQTCMHAGIYQPLAW